jgi:translation initiation factor IF-2
MNNGKVRIYDLSKELNLENKDILAICSQLNIAVKSHSSTISEAEVTAIRAAGKTYSSSDPKPVIRKASPSPVESRNQAPLNSPKKQQILEVRRSSERLEGDHKSELLAPPSAPVSPRAAAAVAKPIEAPSSRTVAPSGPPSSPTSPAKQDANGAVTGNHSNGASSTVSSGTVSSSTVSSPAASSPAVSSPALPSPPASSPPPTAVSPNNGAAKVGKLAASPERPPSPAAAAPSPVEQPPVDRPAAAPRPGGLANKLVLKPSKPAAGPASGTTVLPRAERSESRAPGPSRTEAPKPPAKPQQIVELRRPKPTVAPDGPGPGMGAGPTDAGGPRIVPVLRQDRAARPTAPARPGAPTDPNTSVELLTKPTLPSKVKKKGWEEEEEVVDFDKASKVNPKNKRRGPKIEEDDDEDIDDDEDSDSAVTAEQVTLSLARPAKPKTPGSTGPTAKPISAPSQKKRTSFRDRRDRRQQTDKPERPEMITLTGGVTVQELSQMMAVSETEIIRNLFMKGIAATVTQTLDVTTATTVAEEMGILVDAVEKESAAKKLTEMLDDDDIGSLQRRPPVVTIMGHVDHGKTTLLDSIRKTKVAAGEAGGITQHIGAYHVDVEHNGQIQQVVFLDTPGHEAFTAMRARGARVTDIAILVVAADDGVQPQTIEAISHAKAAGVPIIVAINKIDKEGANADRVKQELTEHDLLAEDWGGSTIMVPVSAMKGDNLDTLLEMILLVAEVEDLHANPDRAAKGTVVEAHLDKAKGPVATLLIQNGTLNVGDILVAGSSLGKVRAMVNDRLQRVKQAGPSFAVEVLGLSDVPAAGDEFLVFKDEKEARAVADNRADQQRQSRLLAAMSSRRVSLNTLSSKAQEGELKELNLVLKADVQGSVEAILGSLKQLPQNEVQVRVLFAAPGEISETDVDLAAASEAVIIGFNTTLATGARQAADRAGVDVRDYNIIYALLDDIQAAMEGLLEPELVEEPLGEVEVRAVFPVGKGAVAGCYVLNGKAIRNCKIRVRRGKQVVFEGGLDSLKRMKEDAKEVNAGYECGVGLDNFNAWELNDIIETYKLVTKRRTLSPTK